MGSIKSALNAVKTAAFSGEEAAHHLRPKYSTWQAGAKLGLADDALHLARALLAFHQRLGQAGQQVKMAVGTWCG